MRFIYIIFIFFVSNLGTCQNPYHIIIDKTSGLPSNSVYDIFQDSNDFMWFATDKGLSRYDGNTVKTFAADFQTSKSGSCIGEDDFGRIWYVNFDGFLYYVEKGTLKAFSQPTALGYFKYGILKKELYLIQPNALLVYDLKTLKIKKKHPILDKQIRSCYATTDKFYVLADCLYEFSANQSVKKYALPYGFHNEIIGPILNYWNQKLIISCKSNSVFYSFKMGEFSKSKFKTNLNFIQNTAVTDHYIWVCTANGIIKNDFKSNQTKSYFTDQNISYVFKDKQQHYWISTLNKGVLFIEDFENKYINIEPRPRTLSAGKEDVFIGVEKDMVLKLNLKSLHYERIFETNNNHSVNQIFADTINDKLFFNSFKFRILDKKNTVTNEYTIAIKDIKKMDHKYFSFAASGILGLFFIDKNAKSSWDFIFNKNKEDEFTGFNQSLLLNKTNGKSTEYNPANNTLYYATNNGLIAVTNDGKSKELKHNKETLFLSKIQRYKELIIGLSTAEKLYTITSQNNVSLFKLPEHLSAKKFHRFCVRSHYCYLFSADGVYEYDFTTRRNQKVISLNNDFEVTDVLLKNNQLLFATSKGIVIKNRNEIGNYLRPKLIINEIQINGKRKEIKELSQLSPEENDVTINFSTLSFIPNENYSVSYKINDGDWKILDEYTKNLKLSSLSAGAYTIQLAINYNNQKIEKQQIRFDIQKPFWQSYSFIFLSAFVTVFLFYLFYRHQIKKMEKQNQMLLEKNELEKNLNLSTLKAIKSQMNPHFFYNALNTIQSYILANDKKQAVNYLSKFSSLTRSILEMTEKEFVSISEEITTIRLYLDIEKARFDEDFEYTIQVENISDLDHHKIPSMLLQPYVENAVKHGLLHKSGLKKLSVSFTKVQSKIEIEIEDNGIGRQKSTELNAIKNKNHNSFATGAMQNRIDLLNKNKTNKITIHFIDKQNQSQQSMGTTVVIKIPLN